jgi:hypothetical protein
MAVLTSFIMTKVATGWKASTLVRAQQVEAIPIIMKKAKRVFLAGMV